MHCTTMKIYCNWKTYVAANTKELDYIRIEVLLKKSRMYERLASYSTYACVKSIPSMRANVKNT